MRTHSRVVCQEGPEVPLAAFSACYQDLSVVLSEEAEDVAVPPGWRGWPHVFYNSLPLRRHMRMSLVGKKDVLLRDF